VPFEVFMNGYIGFYVLPCSNQMKWKIGSLKVSVKTEVECRERALFKFHCLYRQEIKIYKKGEQVLYVFLSTTQVI